jgi:hypothetical protein
MLAMNIRRREFLIGALGTGAVGTAALQTRARVALGQPSVDPLSLGAIGNGVADDLRALDAAFTQAAEKGLPVDGGDRVFGVRGRVHITAAQRPWIMSLRLRQLAPGDGVSTLHFEKCHGIKIDHLAIDVGNSRQAGDPNSSFGLWIEGGGAHEVRNVEVFGDGKNSLIAIWRATKSAFENLVARDAQFDDPAADDDVMQGIWLYGNSDCILRNPAAANLTGNASYVGRRFANLRTRGIVLGDNERVTIISPRVINVEQGIDLTGSDGNRRCVIDGGQSTDCGSVGVKLANSAVGCRVSGHVAERCGMYGFMASGPSEASLQYRTEDCDFIDCTSIDAGYNRIAFANPSGFIVRRGDYDLDFPKGIRFIRCRAIDRQSAKTMEYGFFSEVPASAKPNRLLDCTSVGHARAARAGAWVQD